MAMLTEDIIHYNILTKLPTTSLLRFKCVSKDWYNLITSNPAFINLHHNHALQTNDMVLVYPNQTIDHGFFCLCTYLDASQVDIGRSFLIKQHKRDRDCKTGRRCSKIVGSSNGLICSIIEDSSIEKYTTLCLLNPITSNYRTFSDEPAEPSSSSCSTSYGFGYNSVSNSYKIVKIVTPIENTEYNNLPSVVQVYDTKTNSWKKIEKGVPRGRFIVDGGGLVVHTSNKLNWLIVDLENLSELYTCKPINYSILTFDLETEEFKSILFSDELNRCRIHSLMVSSDSLLYTIAIPHHDHNKFELWAMKEYGVSKSWTKLHTLENRNQVFCRNECRISHKLRKEGKDDMLGRSNWDFETKTTPEFVWCNFEHESMRRVKVLNGIRTRVVSRQPWACVPSLASIPGTNPSLRFQISD